MLQILELTYWSSCKWKAGHFLMTCKREAGHFLSHIYHIFVYLIAFSVFTRQSVHSLMFCVFSLSSIILWCFVSYFREWTYIIPLYFLYVLCFLFALYFPLIKKFSACQAVRPYLPEAILGRLNPAGSIRNQSVSGKGLGYCLNFTLSEDIRGKGMQKY